MDQQIDFVYDFEKDSNEELKHWLFLENVRIEQDKQELIEIKKQLEEERKSFEKLKKEQLIILETKEKNLERERELFQKRWKVMENELRKIAKDNERIANEREYLEREKINFRKSLKNNDEKGKKEIAEYNVSGLFAGTTGLVSVRKRYKDLTKIYHPDNMHGDSSMIQLINKEYEECRKQYEN